MDKVKAIAATIITETCPFSRTQESHENMVADRGNSNRSVDMIFVGAQ